MKIIKLLPLLSLTLALLRIFNVLHTPWLVIALPLAISLLIVLLAIFILKTLSDYDKIIDEEWKRKR